MHEDAELLRRYAEDNSEPAFAELVRRHLGFVYACALRRVGGDAHLAQDVAQQVFASLARHARSVAQPAVLSGWLYTTTKNATAQVVRGERRRQVREQKAYLMNEATSDSAPATDWAHLRPVLDDALDELSDDDRQAVLLRFFESKSFAEIGAALRLAENTARMRVERALDKLQALLARRGVTSTSAALGVALANQEAAAVPAGLAATVTGAALGVGAATGGFFSALVAPIVAASLVVVGGGMLWWQQQRANDALRVELAALRSTRTELARLRQENRDLAREKANVEAWRSDDAELTRLRDEALLLQRQLAARDESGAPSSTVAGPRVVRITGQVDNQGAFEIPPEGITLSALLGKARLKGLAKPSDIRVTRTTGLRPVGDPQRPGGQGVIADEMKVFHLDATRDGGFQIQANDLVYVPERII